MSNNESGSAPNAPKFTSESLNKMMNDRLDEVVNGLAVFISDPVLYEQIVKHPSISQEVLQKYINTRAVFEAALKHRDENPNDNMAWAAYHHASADIILVGGTLWDQIKVSGISSVGH